MNSDSMRHRYYELLQNFNYRQLWLSQLISEIGSQISRIALILFVYHLNQSASAVAGLMLVQTVPVFVLGFFSGALLERFNLKRTMIVMDILRFALVLLLPFVQNLGLIYAISFGIAIGNLFFLPARDAFVPLLVGKSRLELANSLIAMSVGLVLVIGPAIGGVLTASLGYALAFFIDALTFLFSAAFIFRISIPGKPEQFPQLGWKPIITQIRQGFHYVRQSPLIAYLANLVFFTMIAIGILFPLLPEFNSRFLQGNDITFGLISSAYGLGGLFGGPVGEYLANRFGHGKVVYYLLIVDSLIFIVFSLTPFLIPSLVLIALWGINGFAWWVVYITLLQRIVEPQFRGRIFTLMHQLENAGMVIAYGIAMVGIQYLSAATLFLLAGITYLGIVLLSRYHRGFRRLVQLQFEGNIGGDENSGFQ